MSELQLAEKFARAFSSYRAKSHNCLLTENPTQTYWLERKKVEAEREFTLLQTLTGAVWAIRYPHYVKEAEEALQEAKSPIERVMLASLLIAGYDVARHVRLRCYDMSGKVLEIGDDGSSPSLLLIEMQKRIGSFRVDFLLTFRESAYDSDRCPISLANEVILECDGHEFHDRTAAQASGDRRRDRILQRHGISVFRYTGSDIWRDPFGCAVEALAMVSKRENMRRIPQAVTPQISIHTVQKSNA